MKAISIQNISKFYGEVQALKSINVDIEQGEIFGFIGPDGAGKTSLFRILTSLMIPEEGTATVDGSDVVKDYKAIRSKVGYMPGQFSLYQDLSVEENLNFFAGIFKTTVKENYHLIEDIYKQIEPFKNRRAGKLSGGMKQKLALSCALIHKPVVLLLDEPTTGVDVVSRNEFWQMLQKLKQMGITIVVSTPYMDEAVQCDHIALMQKGEILSIDTPQNIVEKFELPLFGIAAIERNKLSQALQEFPGTLSSYWFGDSIHWIPKENSSIEELTKYLNELDFSGLEINNIAASIEDCFMNLMTKS